MKTQLVIMAAGIGSRFGSGIKQLAKVGVNGEVIIEYSIFDAMKAGFDEVVLIIRKDIEKEFRQLIGDKVSKHLPIKYVYQELDDLPNGFTLASDRKKPWGTAHAIYCARSAIDSPFAVINADDYYGKEGFVKIHDYLISSKANAGKLDACMAGFIIGNTLSDNGTVTRGVCKLGANNNLESVCETYEIKSTIDKDGNKKIIGQNDNKEEVLIDRMSLVSMNMWGLPKEFLGDLEEEFVKFLSKNASDAKAEFLLPTYINDLIHSGKMNVKCLPVSDKWFGVTYAEDKDIVVSEFKKLHDNKTYPERLFS